MPDHQRVDLLLAVGALPTTFSNVDDLRCCRSKCQDLLRNQIIVQKHVCAANQRMGLERKQINRSRSRSHDMDFPWHLFRLYALFLACKGVPLSQSSTARSRRAINWS